MFADITFWDWWCVIALWLLTVLVVLFCYVTDERK